jgi:hypothetical protein
MRNSNFYVILLDNSEHKLVYDIIGYFRTKMVSIFMTHKINIYVRNYLNVAAPEN